MAALDGFDDKMRAIGLKLMPEDQQKAMMIKRVDMREVLGGKLGRELTLK